MKIGQYLCPVRRFAVRSDGWQKMLQSLAIYHHDLHSPRLPTVSRRKWLRISLICLKDIGHMREHITDSRDAAYASRGLVRRSPNVIITSSKD